MEIPRPPRPTAPWRPGQASIHDKLLKCQAVNCPRKRGNSSLLPCPVSPARLQSGHTLPRPMRTARIVSRSAIRACLRPRLTIVEDAEFDGSLQEALSALPGLSGSIGDYLEQVLRPLAPRISQDAIDALILETRRELDELAACRTVSRCTSRVSLSPSQATGPSALRSKAPWGSRSEVRTLVFRVATASCQPAS